MSNTKPTAIEYAAIKHDGAIQIAVGRSRKEMDWRSRELAWSDLVKKLSQPTLTPETFNEYHAAPKARRDEIKDVGGFVGGTLKGGRRKVDAVAWRQLLTLDIDNVPRNVDPWASYELLIGSAAVLYSTHSHSPEAPRYRLVVPLSRPVNADEYAAVSRRIAADIGIDLFDDSTYEPHRLMYWPSMPCDVDYIFKFTDNNWLDVEKQLKRYTDWRDPAQWPYSSRKTATLKKLASKQGDPHERPGVIGAFCRTFTIPEAIDKYLSDIYACCDNGRYTYNAGSTAAGLVVYDHGKFAFSHHGTDPASEKLCNAFDLVRLHLFGEQDDETAYGTPTGRLPSQKAMTELAMSDTDVRRELAARRLSELKDDFTDADAEVDPASLEWLDNLTVGSNGKIKVTAHNVLTILQNDPLLKGRFVYDEFKERAIVLDDLPWQDKAGRTSDNWTDADDSGLRLYLEKWYELDGSNKVKDGIEVALLNIRRHPVREYLEGVVWDEQPRLDEFFIKYLAAENTPYVRAVTRCALIGAVARIYEPGCKHDHILVLVGPQGCGKSTVLSRLGGEWFSDSLYTLSGKDAYEQLIGYWILEMGEMAATRKAEIEQIKQFISKQSDSYRSAYGRRTQDHPRQCAFFGTTNDVEFLKDTTGGRRFWPVTVDFVKQNLLKVLTPELIAQIWAEAVTAFKAGEPWHLSRDMEAEARKVQAAHTELNAKQGLIEEYIEKLLPSNWDEMELIDRIDFIHGGNELAPGKKGTVLREYVCAAEVWVELFRGDLRQFTQQHSREINAVLRTLDGWEPVSTYRFGGGYGRQRGFKRKDALLY